MLNPFSPLESFRTKYVPKLPASLSDFFSCSLNSIESSKELPCDIETIFPHGSKLPLLIGSKGSLSHKGPLKIGVVFSGGQAPGGHNVISGLFDSMKKIDQESALIGFLGGPSGIVSGKHKVLSKEDIDRVRNTGGFDLLGSGRTKIETLEQMEASLNVCQDLNLQGLVIIGGDDSNTNAAVLSEFFHQNKCSTCVIGIPKTIDGDLKNEFVPLSFGFDTASKVYAESIGNLARDSLSAKKYYHFVRLMGRSASHIALECALAVRPNYTFISEEVFAKKMTLKDVVQKLCTLVKERAAHGKSYGLILIPEGLIESIADVSTLIQELNQILSKGDGSLEEALLQLTSSSKECFSLIPTSIQKQLLLQRDPHGNVQVSLIETERMLAEMVAEQMQKEKIPFHPLPHFFGYEGRSAFPTNFDASYCYALGHVATIALSSHLSGYMCFISDLHKPIQEWGFGMVPLPSLMQMEMRKGKLKPVIEKALVDLKGRPFQCFERYRKSWEIEDHYAFPGPIQFEGEASFSIPLSLSLERD